MLQGRFAVSTGMPYVWGRLTLPGLGVSTDLWLLLDTGADRTTLLPFDSTRLGIDFSRLPGEIERYTASVGGRSRSKTLPAVLAFTDSDLSVYAYSIFLSILEPHEGIDEIPSLLGRDVLYRWDMRYAYPSRRLTFEVVSADYVYPVNPG